MTLLNMFLVISTFLLMEGVAWFTHKYVMHGLLWSLHRDHHVRDQESAFEWNDLFFLIFAIPGIALIYLGRENPAEPWLWIGIGISVYGLCYVVVHDILIHRRVWKIGYINHPYIRALRHAHALHHKSLIKEHGRCFGMLWIPRSIRSDFKMRASS